MEIDVLLRPLLSLLALFLGFFVGPIKKRIDFERLNLASPGSQSFKVSLLKADLCFEVSSEGELEQVRPLIETGLLDGLLIEIIYSSESVEKKIQALYLKNSKQLRVLRMPFVTFQSISKWVSAKRFIFCRYDFFPELLRLKSRCHFTLISGATKNLGFYKKECFKLFDIIVAATSKEAKKFTELVGKECEIYACDLRIPRIHQRSVIYKETLAGRTYLEDLVKLLEKIELSKKIIIGSAWPSDLKIFDDIELINKVKNKELTVLVVPHKLDDQAIDEIYKTLSFYFGDSAVSVLSKDNPKEFAPVMILRVSGVLCEIYNHFAISYIGGGYERSIHSVFEPFFSNNIVIVGPRVHRSTEYDYIQANLPGEIHVLKNPESFYTIVKNIDILARDLSKRQKLIDESFEEMQRVNRRVLKRENE